MPFARRLRQNAFSSHSIITRIKFLVAGFTDHFYRNDDSTQCTARHCFGPLTNKVTVLMSTALIMTANAMKFADVSNNSAVSVSAERR